MLPSGSSPEVPEQSLSDIASWAAGLRFEAVPPEAIALAKLAFLDTIAVSLSGTRLEATRIVARMVAGQAPGGAAWLIGFGAKASASGAALVNGTAAHADLFDDNSAPMIAHPSAPLVSALLPLAEARGLSGQAVLTAYVVGFEINVRLGRLLNDRSHLYRA